MSDNGDKPRFDRRRVLKTIGAAGAIGAFSSSASALEGDEKNDRVEEALQTDSFATFESEFGSISADPENSRVTQHGSTGDRAVRVELQTSLGRMGVIMLEKSDESVDMTLLDLSAANADAVPAEYVNVPERTKPLAFATSEGGEIEFRREATRPEKEALARKTGIPISDLEANLETEKGGFVVGGGTELNEDDYVVVRLDEITFREVSASRIEAQTAVKKEVSAELSWWCRYKCGNCLAKAAKCAGCCLATSLGCIACIIWQCGLGAKSCYDCYGCLE